MTDIPNNHNVGRYCSKRTITESGRISSAAFNIFPKDQGYLSVNHLEKINSDTSKQINYLRKYYINKILQGRTPKKSGAKIAILNVNNACNLINNNPSTKAILRFIDKCTKNDHSYAGIYGIEIDDEIASQLLSQAVYKSHELLPSTVIYTHFSYITPYHTYLLPPKYFLANQPKHCHSSHFLKQKWGSKNGVCGRARSKIPVGESPTLLRE